MLPHLNILCTDLEKQCWVKNSN